MRDGLPLNEAYEIALRARTTPDRDTLRERLAREARDLMAIVQDGKMTIREALAILAWSRTQATDVLNRALATDPAFPGQHGGDQNDNLILAPASLRRPR